MVRGRCTLTSIASFVVASRARCVCCIGARARRPTAPRFEGESEAHASTAAPYRARNAAQPRAAPSDAPAAKAPQEAQQQQPAPEDKPTDAASSRTGSDAGSGGRETPPPRRFSQSEQPLSEAAAQYTPKSAPCVPSRAAAVPRAPLAFGV